MSSDDPNILKSSEISLAESLDNSIKTITGMKHGSLADEILKLDNSPHSLLDASFSDRNEISDLNTSIRSISSDKVTKTNTISVSNASIKTAISKTGSTVKFPSKTFTGTIAKDPATGQYVLIQPNTGTTVPVRLASNTGNAAATSNTKQLAIQVVRRADGNLVPIKSNKPINLNNVSISGNKLINPGQTILLNKGSTSTSTSLESSLIKQTMTNTIANSTQKTLKTITVSDSQKCKVLPAQSTLLNHPGKIVVKADYKKHEDNPRVISQKFIKLSPSTSTGSGNMQSIQISSKTGGPVQFVRVLNPSSSHTAASKETSSPTKFFVRNSDGQIKMVTKINQSQSLSDGKSILGKEKIISQQQLQKLTTIPTLKKIDDPSVIGSTNNKILTIPQKSDSERLLSNEQLKQQLKQRHHTSETFKPKPRILNNLTGLTGNLSVSSDIGENGQPNPIKREQFLVVPQSMYRTMKSSPKKSILLNSVQSSTPESPKKLFTVLKPSAQYQETLQGIVPSSSQYQQLQAIQRARSPSPSDSLRRKHCNCTKSQCLKLYCDCFANGEFCQDCNCKECFNNLEYEDERQKAIKMCLERNPAAFKPKITKARDQHDLRLHNKGCNCKRSGCLKNYCECYEAKIACSSNCKCIGCRNIEDRTGIDMADINKIAKNFGRGIPTKRSYEDLNRSMISSNSKFPSIVNDLPLTQQPPSKQAYNFITQDVVDATIQCMIAQADECQKGSISSKTTERMILEELGRCLVEIIDFSIKNYEN